MNSRNEFDDTKLNDAGQKMVRELVSNLPEDELSLAWRSALNEQLLQTAQAKRKRQRFLFVFRPAMGLALAGAMAAVVMIRTSQMSIPTVRDTSNLEAVLVQDHQQNIVMSDLAGFSMIPAESRPTEGSISDPWSEFDLESL
jgi:hypothetical protein